MSWSRTFDSHPDWNGRSSHDSSRYTMRGPGVYTARDLRNLNTREREEVHRQAYDGYRRGHDTPRHRSNLRATMDNVSFANHADRRDRGYTEPFRSRRAERAVYWQDELPFAPEPPRPSRRDSQYGRYADPARSSQRSSTWEDQYVDAHQWIYGDRTPQRHTAPNNRPPRNSGNSRYHEGYEAPNLRFGTSTSRRVDPSDTRESLRNGWRSAFRRWW